MTAVPASKTTPALAQPDVAAKQPPPDPGILGVPMFTLATLTVGLSTLGYLPTASGAGVLPILVAATGLGQLIAAVWAMALGDTMVAALSGIFAAFWLSDAALNLGQLHGWYGTQPADASQVESLFLLSWTVVFFLVFIATLRLPRVFSTMLASIVATGVLLTISATTGSDTATTAAGIGLLVIAGHGAYLLLNIFDLATGGRGLPLGRPTISRKALAR